eukprot:tig00000492_g1421.t1
MPPPALWASPDVFNDRPLLDTDINKTTAREWISKSLFRLYYCRDSNHQWISKSQFRLYYCREEAAAKAGGTGGVAGLAGVILGGGGKRHPRPPSSWLFGRHEPLVWTFFARRALHALSWAGGPLLAGAAQCLPFSCAEGIVRRGGPGAAVLRLCARPAAPGNPWRIQPVVTYHGPGGSVRNVPVGGGCDPQQMISALLAVLNEQAGDLRMTPPVAGSRRRRRRRRTAARMRRTAWRAARQPRTTEAAAERRKRATREPMVPASKSPTSSSAAPKMDPGCMECVRADAPLRLICISTGCPPGQDKNNRCRECWAKGQEKPVCSGSG